MTSVHHRTNYCFGSRPLLSPARPTPLPAPPPGTVNQCCNSVQQSNSAGLAGILGLLGVVLDAVVPIGLGCSPITVLGNNWFGSAYQYRPVPSGADQWNKSSAPPLTGFDMPLYRGYAG
ncbi:hypothetical protein B0H14DRAFT_2557047 [Mycena olivaceomarginata]|nr:hypothetical protein B0H14DRAFT_2557047 [Mycena olivaceomarginata]